MNTRGSGDRALIIVNPRSGTVRARPSLLSRLRRAGGEAAEVRATEDLADLKRLCVEAADRGIQRVGCVGGDGTASAVVSALAEAYDGRPLPELAFLRGGTMNTIASCMGTPAGSPDALLSRWLTRPYARLERAPLRVGDTLGFLFGVGLFPNWLEAYYEAGHGHPTPRTAARMTLATAVSAVAGGKLGERVIGPVHARVETDGDPWPDDSTYYCFMAGAVDEVGLGFRIFPHATADAERVDFIGLSSPSWKLALALPRMLRKGSGPPASISDERLVREATLRSTNGPLLYSVDGDLYRTEAPLTVRRGPVFTIAVPS